jgi:hypothetical protein
LPDGLDDLYFRVTGGAKAERSYYPLPTCLDFVHLQGLPVKALHEVDIFAPAADPGSQTKRRQLTISADPQQDILEVRYVFQRLRLFRPGLYWEAFAGG